MQAHIDTEEYLQQLSQSRPEFGYTVIREGLYTESYPLYTAFFDPENPRGEIKIPHDGSGPGIAWVKREELGEGTSELIRRFVQSPIAFEHCNSTVLLSGPKALTLAETVAALSKLSKKTEEVTIRKVSDEEYAKQPQNAERFTYQGVDYSHAWVTSFEAFRRGEGSFVSPLLEELLGRKPEEFETTIGVV
jgi:hypothetical protein